MLGKPMLQAKCHVVASRIYPQHLLLSILASPWVVAA